MQIKTREVGGVLRLGDNPRIVIHRRQGERIVPSATTPVGTDVFFDATRKKPISGTAGHWSHHDLAPCDTLIRSCLLGLPHGGRPPCSP